VCVFRRRTGSHGALPHSLAELRYLDYVGKVAKLQELQSVYTYTHVLVQIFCGSGNHTSVQLCGASEHAESSDLPLTVLGNLNKVKRQGKTKSKEVSSPRLPLETRVFQ